MTAASAGRKFYRFPAAWIDPLCEILGDDSLQRHLLSEKLRVFLRIGEHEISVQREKAAALGLLPRDDARSQ
jgi:hypothetical protein